MKKVFLITLIVIVITVIVLVSYLKFALPNVGPATDLKVEITPDRVASGEYLANHVTVCMDCHSTRDWSRFSGPLVLGTLGKGGEFFGEKMGFPGNFYSKNITPFHLKGWSDGEILRAFTSGVSKDGTALFPVMPYTYYGRMDREDAEDIIAYLRTLKPIDNTPPAHSVDFPVNFLINTMPQLPAFTTRPPASDTIKYGAYLTNAAGCRECHTPATRGEIILSKAFIGGRLFEMPGEDTYSANLTPDVETGIGAWSAKVFILRFKAYNDSANVPKVSGGDPQTVMPWTMYAGMDSTDLLAIYKYLRTLKPVRNKVVHFVSTGTSLK